MNHPLPSSPRLPRRVAVAVGLLLTLSTYVCHYALELSLDRLEVFEQYNVIFQADPNERIGAMSHGWGESGRNLAHPNLANFTSPAVRILAKAVVLTKLTDAREEDIRRSIGLVIVPAVAGLTAGLVFVLFLLAGFSLAMASTLAVFGAVFFSSLVFGSIPDHFALSAFVIATGYLLAVDALRTKRIRWWLWGAVGAVAAGITITNIVIIAVLLATVVWSVRSDRMVSTLKVAGLVAASLIVTVAFSLGMNRVVSDRNLEAGRTGNWTQRNFNEHVPGKIVRFPEVIGATVAPANLSLGPPTKSYRPDDRYQFRFTFDTDSYSFSYRSIPAVLSFLLMGYGLFVSLRHTSTWAPIGVASAIIIVYNWAFHSAWGGESFLYSQHWALAGLFLIGTGAQELTRKRAKFSVILGIFVVAVAAHNMALIREMLAILRSGGI